MSLMPMNLMPMNLMPIVICDDDPDDRFLAIDALSESGVINPVLEATDGEVLIHLLRGTGPYSLLGPVRPAVILLDLNMPRLNGREVLVAMSKDLQLQDIPVIILTTAKAHSDDLRMVNFGAMAFVTKPVDFDSLIAIMARLPNLVAEVKVALH
jgi:CheY-like chemotaxis protein